MLKYPLEKVIAAIREVCTKFILTQSLELKRIKYIPSRQLYIITVADESQRSIPQELINMYIENFGEKGGLEIAGHLRHSIELEESIFERGGATSEEFWDGDMNDVIDYLDQKEKKETEET